MEQRREDRGFCDFRMTITDAVFIESISANIPSSPTNSQARVMGLCVLLAGGLLHLTTQGGGAGRSAGGQLLPVWLSLLVFESLRALGFAWRFWKDPKYVYGKRGGNSRIKRVGCESEDQLPQRLPSSSIHPFLQMPALRHSYRRGGGPLSPFSLSEGAQNHPIFSNGRQHGQPVSEWNGGLRNARMHA